MKLRYKILIGLFVIAVATGASLYVFRQPVFFYFLARAIQPEMAFGEADAPPAPDYAELANWAAHPDKEDASDLRPPGFEDDDAEFKDEVDIFYVHPTGFFGKHNWNAAIGERSDPGIPVEAMLSSQASPFNGMGKVYAPHYRQATLYSFFEPNREPGKTNGFQALELAYSDVARAYDYFAEHYNKGRPFILASHSQGSQHMLRLLAEKIDQTDHYDRLIAAYVIGCHMPEDYFDRVLTNVKPCTAPDQTGCAISWDAYREGTPADGPRFHYYPTGWEIASGKKPFVVNPLTWTTSEDRAPATANLGALFVDMDPETDIPSLRPLAPEFTWAECHDGILWTAKLEDASLQSPMVAGGVYHIYDYHFFWANIRENANVRAHAWLQAQQKTE